MKKGISNDNHQDGQEQSRKLYRSISDSAKQLDDAHSCAQSVGDLFTPTLQIQRSRFQEFCERLIFADPTLFGRKAEELLWRKAYYDVISASKKLKKKEYTVENLSNIQTHINAGIGHYHHFISRIQHHYNLDVKNFVDFAIFKEDFKKLTNLKLEHVDWAKQSIHRCLIYLGDLNRYKLDIYPNLDTALALRYYLSGVLFKPDYGVPHNQMGTLASIQNRTLDAVYHYMCCLACKHSFDGTENNLLRLFEKNSRSLDEFPIENPNADCIVQLESAEHIKRLICRFLLLIETWYFNKSYTDIYILCHQTNVDLQECLIYSKPISTDNEDLDSVDTDSLSSPAYLTEDAIFKVSAISLLCIVKLQKLQLAQLSIAVAFTLAIYSQLLQMATDHIQEAILNITTSTIESESPTNQINGLKKDKNKSKNKIRRRRKKKYSSEEDTDVSDSEVLAPDSNSDASVDGSEDEVGLSSSDNESGDENNLNKTNVEETHKHNNTNHVIVNGNEVHDNFDKEKMKAINPNTLLDIITEEKLLQSIKILSDWFSSDIEIVKSCGKTTRSLLKQIIRLLNLVNINFDSPKLADLKNRIRELQQDESKIFLPEDKTLNGIEFIFNSRKSYDYVQSKRLTLKDETLVRIMKLVSFGHFLAKVDETGITFDAEKQMFEIQTLDVDEVNGVENDGVIENSIVEPEIDSSNEIKSFDNKQNKMKHMGQLWLAAEVRALENRVRSKTSLSPYLVLDADCLTQFISVVRHLVNSKKFIVVVPSAVVSALDDLKKEKLEARDAIRWLELQFHHGNRFCRAQRPQECTTLPLIKYPKKKDKDTFAYIQIIECCYYLTQQQKNSSNLVTLLLGNKTALSNSENKDFSYVGLAHSVGINLEYVSDFYDKWRKNYKGKK